MSKLTSFFTELMRKYLSDPFVFAIGLTLLMVLLAFLVEGQGLLAASVSWGMDFARNTCQLCDAIK